jgi:hypothetical protein
MRKLVFFLGPAGAGKTTLSKTLARRRKAALFDMDTLTRPVAEAIMGLVGLDPNDRDSLAYKKHCRDVGYRITMDAALENVELGLDAYVIGPFTKESTSPAWLEAELQRIGASLNNVDVKVVFVHLDGIESYYTRLKERGSPLDVWKLGNWSEFSQSLQIRDVKWELPADSILYFNNSQQLSETHISVVEHFLYGYK